MAKRQDQPPPQPVERIVWRDHHGIADGRSSFTKDEIVASTVKPFILSSAGFLVYETEADVVLAMETGNNHGRRTWTSYIAIMKESIISRHRLREPYRKEVTMPHKGKSGRAYPAKAGHPKSKDKKGRR